MPPAGAWIPMRLLPIMSSLALLLAGGAYAAGPAGGRQCFRSHDYQGFRPVDDHTFIIRTGVDDHYRIETEGSCPELTYPQATLLTVVRGSDLICGPLDWDLRVGQTGPAAFFAPCIVRSQTKLSKEEVAALPKSQKP